MNIREKIILLIMILVVLYGGFEMLRLAFSTKSGDSSIQRTAPEEPEYMRIANRINRSIDKQELNSKESYIMDVIRKPWIKDVFYTRSVSNPTEPVQAKRDKQRKIEEWKKQLNYNGYVNAGSKILAVINGSEYEEGDTLDTGNFKLIRATPEKVYLQKDDLELSISRSRFKY